MGAIAVVPLLGAIVRCHCWVPLLGCHCWVPLWGAMAGCHCWRHCCVPLRETMARKIDQSATPFSAAFFSALITHKLVCAIWGLCWYNFSIWYKYISLPELSGCFLFNLTSRCVYDMKLNLWSVLGALLVHIWGGSILRLPHLPTKSVTCWLCKVCFLLGGRGYSFNTPMTPYEQWKNPGCLVYIGDDNPTHLYWDFNKPL